MITRIFIFLILFVNLIDATQKLRIPDITKYGLSQEEVRRSPNYDGKVYNVNISTEAGQEMIEHWVNQGFSGLIAAIATRRLHLVEEYQKNSHEKCASQAETLSEHAKCLQKLEKDAHFNRLLHRKRFFDQKIFEKRNEEMLKMMNEQNKWMGSFKISRKKREIKIKNRKDYVLKSEKEKSPFGVFTTHLANAVKLLKKKDSISRWQDTIERISTKAKEMKKQKDMEKAINSRLERYSQATQLSHKSQEMEKGGRFNDDIEDMEKYIDNDELKAIFKKKTKKMSDADKLMYIPMNMIRKATKIGLDMSGYNTTGFDRKIVRIISPKIMSVVSKDEEAENNEIDLLSPSLFALHEEGDGVEKEASMRNLLGSLTNSQDSQKFLDVIIEATGVNEAMDQAEQKLSDLRRLKDDALGRGPHGQPLYFTKENVTERYPQEAKKIEMMEKLEKMYSEEQLREMNRTGYTVLTHEQLDHVYGKGSVNENLKFLKTAKSLSRREIDREIMKTISQIADEKVKFEARRKDVVLSPITFTAFVENPVGVSQPVILSPVLLSYLWLSPAIYGVMIMSPWCMVPVLISPRILSPVVINPFLMVPVIISPLAFNPFILCPGTMNPFVLSPLLLSPFILSPQVMTPLILNPFCLGPIILNPLALSPLILSPFVLSPTILSPQFVTAVVLSPYALSPAWHSDGAMVTVFASPSWLS